VLYNRRWRRYDGTYAKRGGDKPDGCATLWRTDAFRLLAEETIHFSEYALRDNVALIVVLEARQQADADSNGVGPPQRVILGNCHILFNPKRGTHVSVAGCSDVEMAAAVQLLNTITRACRPYGACLMVGRNLRFLLHQVTSSWHRSVCWPPNSPSSRRSTTRL